MARISGVRVGATAVFTAAATLLVGVGVPANAAPPSPVSPQPAPQSKSVRGDVSAQRGIVVRDLKVSSNHRVVSANVRWNPGLIALKGNRDRFNLRLVAFPDQRQARRMDLNHGSQPSPAGPDGALRSTGSNSANRDGRCVHRISGVQQPKSPGWEIQPQLRHRQAPVAE